MKFKINKITGIIIGVVALSVILLIFILVTNDYIDKNDIYLGSKNPLTGEWCDYGFHIKNQTCCDEDDYSCEICTNKDYDCVDFSTQKDAQHIYNKCAYFFKNNKNVDVHNLDNDNNGIACEFLP